MSSNATSLRPATCQIPVMPGRTDHTLSLPLLVVLELVRSARPWANQAHLTLQNVDQLRQFIQAEFSQKSAYRSDARIICNFEQLAIDTFLTDFSSYQLGDVILVNFAVAV